MSRSQFCFRDIILNHPVFCFLGIVDGINGVTKSKLTTASARELKSADDGDDVKKMDASTMKDGILTSAASECCRWLELEGTRGMKSVRKGNKRESKSHFKAMHYVVSEAEEKLIGLKYEAPILPKGVSASEMYNIYCCPQFGVQRVARRRIPCLCEACDAMLKLPWLAGVLFEKQPRFQRVVECKFKNVLGAENDWHIVKLKQRTMLDPNWSQFMNDEADAMRDDIQEHLTAIAVDQIVVGEVGAVVTADEDTDGYYLVEWVSLPFYCQEREELVVEGHYLNPVEKAATWFTKSKLFDTHLVRHVVDGCVTMECISATNQLPKGCRIQEATSLGAMKINSNDHEQIIEEIIRRDGLEDPDYDRIEEAFAKRAIQKALKQKDLQ